MVLQGMRMGMMMLPVRVRVLGRMAVVWLVVVRLLLVVVRCPPVARQVASSRMVRVGTAVGIGVMLLMVGVPAIRLGEPAGTLGQVHVAVAVAMMVGIGIGMGRRIIAAVIVVVVLVPSTRSLLPAVAAPVLRTGMRRTRVVRRHRQLVVVVVAAVGRRPLVVIRRGMHVHVIAVVSAATGRVLERSLVAAQRHGAGTIIAADTAAAS